MQIEVLSAAEPVLSGSPVRLPIQMIFEIHVYTLSKGQNRKIIFAIVEGYTHIG